MDRIKDWKKFSEQMVRHIRIYAEKQYEDSDVNIKTSQECITAINKYTSRYGKNVRGNLEAMRDMFKTLREDPATGECMEVLSMGMSGDYQTAVEYGATMVRVGTAIFGKRS